MEKFHQLFSDGTNFVGPAATGLSQKKTSAIHYIWPRNPRQAISRNIQRYHVNDTWCSTRSHTIRHHTDTM